MSNRLLRVSENLQHELSLILQEELAGQSGLVTITSVFVTPDLRQATVWLSTMNYAEPDKLVESLNQRSADFFAPLRERLRMKHVPQLTFRIDEKKEEIERIDELLDTIE